MRAASCEAGSGRQCRWSAATNRVASLLDQSIEAVLTIPSLSHTASLSPGLGPEGPSFAWGKSEESTLARVLHWHAALAAFKIHFTGRILNTPTSENKLSHLTITGVTLTLT